MDAHIGYLNEGKDVEEDLVVYQHGGDYIPPEPALEALWQAGYSKEDMDEGDWVTVADGEVINVGEMHPFLIMASED